MGLSASQAKLLSITTRLSDNELRSQSIANAKMSLSQRSADAGKEYTNALENTQLMFSTYDADGNKITQNLTGFSLTEYSELKNQYGIVNTSGQIMVSERDAANYKDSKNIVEFLGKYGFNNSFKQEVVTEINTGKYNEALDEYYKKLDEWKADEPQKQIENIKTPAWTEIVEEGWKTIPAWTERVHQGELYNKLLSSFFKQCFNGTLDSQFNCYMHVMSSILGAGHYVTSDGNEFDIIGNGEECEHGKWWCWNVDRHPIPEELKEDLKTRKPCGEIHDETVDLVYNGKRYQVPCKDDDCDKNTTVWQKIIDLLWKVHDDYQIDVEGNGGTYNPEHAAEFFHLLEFDLDEVTLVQHPEEKEYYSVTKEHPAVIELIDNPEYGEWLEREPERPNAGDKEFQETKTTINVQAESDEGQWYINLWHRMNGASIYKTTVNGFDNGIHDPENDGVITGDNVKSPTNGLTEGGQILWTVLEDGLMGSSDWLKYALDKGYISLERVNYTNPAEYGSGLKYYSWVSTIYSNAADISEEQDETSITKAEAEYKNKIKNIQSTDKLLDGVIKRLDSEHEALKTEYDSIKTIIDKTIERNLKLYS